MTTTTQPARARRTGRVALTLLAVAGVAAGLTAGASAQSPSAAALPPVEEGTFQMGIEPWIGYGPWWIADQKGYFAQNGVQAQITNFNTDADINAALISGQINGANIATHTALRLMSEGTPITAVLLLDQSNAADAIVAGKDITSIADLKGKQVAYEEGTTSDILLRYALSQNGLTIDDVEPVLMGASDAGVAVTAGQVPAAVTYEPYITSALAANPDLQLLYKAAEKPGLIGDVFVVQNDYLAAHPGQVDALIRAWGDAMTDYAADPAGGQAIIEKAVGADAGSLKTAFDGVQLYDLASAKALMTGGEYGATIKEVKDIALAAGIMTNDVDETKLVDTSYISAVQP
ncbi:MAG: ABC transporter substrate-binding protein [Chloroflexota bacterium]